LSLFRRDLSVNKFYLSASILSSVLPSLIFYFAPLSHFLLAFFLSIFLSRFLSQSRNNVASDYNLKVGPRVRPNVLSSSFMAF
jgi:hypothetical protein